MGSLKEIQAQKNESTHIYPLGNPTSEENPTNFLQYRFASKYNVF